MRLNEDIKKIIFILSIFLIIFYLPLGNSRFDNAIMEGLYLVKWYAREHVLLCLIPAFFIAGAISVFISQAGIIEYLGVKANKFLAYGVASVSGIFLSVCSCTVLPLFAGIYKMGAGLGPACAFLYAGPAINILAILLTGRVLGLELGIARALGAIIFSIIIGILMQIIFCKEEDAKKASAMMPKEQKKRPLWLNTIYFVSMIGILVFANWINSNNPNDLWSKIYDMKWELTGISLCVLVLVLILMKMSKSEFKDWIFCTWEFTKQILPLLFIGVLIAGLLLGRVGHEGLIPSDWVVKSVGGNSFASNFFAAFAGVFMYFATLTEIPILEGLIGNGMGKGPALALLLAGPALSLPNMIVINSVLGFKKTAVFIILVIVMATISGMLFGTFFK